MPSPSRPSPEQLRRYADEFNKSRSLQYMGMRLEFPSAEKVVIHIDPVRDEMRGGLGSSAVNGGVLAAVFDLAIGCTPALIDPTRRTATMQLSMSFMKPVTGNRFRAEAWIDSASKTTVYSTAVLLDEAGQSCARCQGVSRMSTLGWARGDTPAIN